MIYIYVKSTCPYSHKAISLLKKSNIDYETITMDDAEEWKDMKVQLSKITGASIRTVPQAFIQYSDTGEIHYIGDSQDLEEFLME